MATGSVYDAIADLELLGQKPSLERISELANVTMRHAMNHLKVNKDRLNLNDGKIHLKPGAADTWIE
jgi:hypothetical protein